MCYYSLAHTMPGALRTIININFNNVTNAVERTKMLCESATSTKVKVKQYVTLLNNYFQEETWDQETQTLDGEVKMDEENEKIDCAILVIIFWFPL